MSATISPPSDSPPRATHRSMTRRVPASPCRAEMPAAASSSRRWRLRRSLMPSRSRTTLPRMSSPAGAADAQRLPHDVIRVKQVDDARGKDGGGAPIGQRPGLVAIGNDQRRRALPLWRGTRPASPASYRDRDSCTGRRARCTPISPVPAPKLQHEIVRTRAGPLDDRLRHGGTGGRGKSGPRVVAGRLLIERAGRTSQTPSLAPPAQARARTVPIMPLSSCSRMWQW